MRYIYILSLLIFISCKTDTKNTENQKDSTEAALKQKALADSIEKANKALAPKQTLSYKQYCNPRFQFCLNYPSNFIAQPPPVNGDGLSFISSDSTVQFSTWGAFDATFEGLEGNMASVSQNRKITYKTMNDSSYVISGYERDGSIFYQKTLFKKDIFYTFQLIYPDSLRSTYDEACAKIGESFKIK